MSTYNMGSLCGIKPCFNDRWPNVFGESFDQNIILFFGKTFGRDAFILS